MSRRAGAARRALLACLLLAGCSGQRLDLYTLDVAAAPVASPARQVVATLVVSHVSLPLELDNDDMLTSDGARFRRSVTGRWASRLSALVTRRLVQRLGEALPDELVTDQALGGAASARLLVHIASIDIGADRSARIAADWRLLAQNTPSQAAPQRFAETIVVAAPGDQAQVDATARLLDDLAARIAALGRLDQNASLQPDPVSANRRWK